MSGTFINIGSLTRLNGRIASLSRTLLSNQFVLEGVTASAAYGLRKLTSGYNGSAIRVRRSSDNTESDIGFDVVGNLNQATLTSFVGVDSGFVTIWYDQSGNSLDLSMSIQVNQPRIVNAGVIDTMNGKVAVFSPDATRALGRTTAIAAATNTSLFFVGRPTAITSFPTAFSIGSSATGVNGPDLVLTFVNPGFSLSWGEGGLRATSSTITPLNASYIISRVSTGPLPAAGNTPSTALLSAYVNGVLTPNGATAASGFGGYTFVTLFGVTNGTTTPIAGRGYQGYITEAIVLPTALFDSQRQTIQYNQGIYYGITVL